MRIILSLTLLMLFSMETHAQEIIVPDSIAIILKPRQHPDSKLNRSNFTSALLNGPNFKLPIIIINDSSYISSIISLLSSGESVSRVLEYDTNQQLYSLNKLPNGDYDLKKGFTIDNNEDIHGLIVFFRTDGYELIWLGKDRIDIGRKRWDHPNIFNRLKELIDEY